MNSEPRPDQLFQPPPILRPLVPTPPFLPLSPFSLPVGDGETQTRAQQRHSGPCHSLRPWPSQQRHKVCKGRKMSPSTTTCCGSRAKTTTLVPDGSLPTGVAVSTRPILSAQLPTVTEASVLWVPWILKGQALRLPLQTAALCAGEWEKGRGASHWEG